MPRLLIISYWYEPFDTIGSSRIKSFVCHLAGMGWDIGVISVKDHAYSHDGRRKTEDLPATVWQLSGFSWSVFIRKLSAGRIKGAAQATAEGRTTASAFKRFVYWLYNDVLTFPDECWPWYTLSAKRAVHIAKEWKPDIILSSAMPPTSHVLASKIQKRLSCPWLADYRDLWTGHGFHGRSEKLEQKHSALQNKILANATCLSTVSKAFARNLESNLGKRCHTIYNGFEPQEKAGSPATSPDKVRIVYTGMIYPLYQEPSIFFEALGCLDVERRNKVCFYYVGPNDKMVRELAEKHRVESICDVRGSVPKEEALRLQKETDVLLFFSFNIEGWLSGKLLEYVGSGKAILSVGPEEVESKEIVNDANESSQVCTSVGETVAGLLKLLDGERPVGALSDNALFFTRENQARKLDGVLRGMLDGQ